MNPNSMCVVENEVLRARLKRNKELARKILEGLCLQGFYDRDEVIEMLNEIIDGK